MEDEQQTGIYEVSAQLDVFTAHGFIQITSAQAQAGIPGSRQQHSNLSHSWGYCLLFTQAPVCFALEENAA